MLGAWPHSPSKLRLKIGTIILTGVSFGMLNLHALFPCTDDSTDDTLAAELANE
jgi:hypothetical protein